MQPATPRAWATPIQVMRSALKMASRATVSTFVLPALLAAVLFVVCSADYPYKENYTTQYVDHFNYKNKATFQARYLISGSSTIDLATCPAGDEHSKV